MTAVAAVSAAALAVVASLAFLLARTRTGMRRDRLALVGSAAAIGASSTAVTTAAAAMAGGDWAGWGALASALATAAAILVGVGVQGATRRLAASFLRGAVTAVALASAGLAGAAITLLVVGRFPEHGEHGFAGAAVAAAVAAALVAAAVVRVGAPMAERLRRHPRLTPADVVERFGARVTGGLADDELDLQLVESLRAALQLRRAQLWVLEGDQLVCTTSVPSASPEPVALTDRQAEALAGLAVAGEAWLGMWLPALMADRDGARIRVSPARHGGRALGVVLSERSADDPLFEEADDVALAELGSRLGVVLHNRRLGVTLQGTLDELRRANADLRASRARLVSAADAERRRIERDIHDGAQQHLVAIAVELGLLRQLVAGHPEATEAVEEMSQSVRETITQLRDLAHGIYPPLLAEAGLGEALREAGLRAAGSVTVLVDAPVRRHQADVETAVYFCCVEAMQNAAKHAPGSRVDVRVWDDDGGLRFEVSDNGPGFDPASVTAGQGRRNMTDRVGAVGGTLEWRAAPGRGTTVAGWLPATVEVT